MPKNTSAKIKTEYHKTTYGDSPSRSIERKKLNNIVLEQATYPQIIFFFGSHFIDTKRNCVSLSFSFNILVEVNHNVDSRDKFH